MTRTQDRVLSPFRVNISTRANATSVTTQGRVSFGMKTRQADFGRRLAFTGAFVTLKNPWSIIKAWSQSLHDGMWVRRMARCGPALRHCCFVIRAGSVADLGLELVTSLLAQNLNCHHCAHGFCSQILRHFYSIIYPNRPVSSPDVPDVFVFFNQNK